MKKVIILTMFGLILLVSCRPNISYSPYNVDYIKKGTLAKDILIMETEPSKPYIAIGYIEVSKKGNTSLSDVSSADLIPLLQQEAANAGGDAVINVKFERYEGGISGYGLLGKQPVLRGTGTVIVFK